MLSDIIMCTCMHVFKTGRPSSGRPTWRSIGAAPRERTYRRGSDRRPPMEEGAGARLFVERLGTYLNLLRHTVWRCSISTDNLVAEARRRNKKHQALSCQ